jgi:hypothetical protein
VIPTAATRWAAASEAASREIPPSENGLGLSSVGTLMNPRRAAHASRPNPARSVSGERRPMVG